jgi:hypothetical protein
MAWREILPLAALLAIGCARLPTATNTPARLPAARMSDDSVVLQVAFVRLPAAETAAYDAIWNEIDEQALPPELRRELATNGLRAGVVGLQLPAPLRERIDAKRNVLEERSEDVDASEVENGGGSRRLQVRAGRRSKIQASKTYPTLSLLLVENGAEPGLAPIVRGHQLNQAQCILALKGYPQGDGRVKLDITPEVEHGELKQNWAGAEGSLMLRLGRERIVIDRLRLETIIAPGESLVLSTTPEIKGLGEYCFSETVGGRVERTFLLIRLAQTQFDDLFAPDRSLAPLATPGE